MKYFYLVCGIVATCLAGYLHSETDGLLAMICFATYSIMDRLPKVQEPKTKTKTPPTFDMNNVTRLEVINHAENNHPIGRFWAMYEDKDFKHLDLEFQDNGRTLKIFLS